MKLLKRALLCVFASAAFGVLWLVLLNLIDVASVKNYELIVFAVMVIASIFLTLLFTLRHLKQTEISMPKKVGYIVAVTVPSFVVMVGGFYTAIFLGLTYLH